MVVHMFSLSFGDIEGVNVAFDTKQSVTHILELDEGVSLSESIQQVQQQILSRIQSFGHSCEQTRWLLYDLHGGVSEYSNGTLTAKDLNDRDIYVSFAKILKVRRLIRKF
jgi:hypothetical protein